VFKKAQGSIVLNRIGMKFGRINSATVCYMQTRRGNCFLLRYFPSDVLPVLSYLAVLSFLPLLNALISCVIGAL